MVRKCMRKLAKFVGVWILFLVVGRVAWRRLHRLYHVIHLFDPERIVGNFLGMDKIFPTKTVHKSAQPYHFKQGAVMALPESFVVDGVRMNSAEFLTHTVTTGLLVLKNDQIVFEQYYQGHSETTRHISWSVAKSFVSALFGIALERGLIRSIEETVTDYLPAMRGTGYDGVRIKDVLQMSSGVRFDEDYGAFGSDINRFGRVLALGGS
ncbi:MAG TPA: class C beta-lactamase-related serine hydrolase, partial [Anaerolineae bacterium]|nr:class C beta-lactamase-related serine hydrolase [Anaerolineae bacterium]